MKKTSLPMGMHDKLFKRARVTYQIERVISDLLMERGFNRIETPTLEHVEVFGDEVNPSHYNLFDKNGALLSLRPDITSQIGRVIASTQVETPIKFSYSGKVFHYNEEMRGLINEQTQAGVEIVGFPVEVAMPEAIYSAQAALDKAQVRSYRFEFSHAVVLQTIFAHLSLTAGEQKNLMVDIVDKNITKLKEFTKAHPSDFDVLIQRLPYLFGESSKVLAAARQITDDRVILSALDEVEELIGQVKPSLGQVNLDLAQFPSMPYYTGVMFKVFGDKVPDAFVSGGRYDKLFERFGASELTAVGWAIDIDSVYQAIHHSLKEGDS